MHRKSILLFMLAIVMTGCGGDEVAPMSEADIDAAIAGVANKGQVQYFLTEELKLTSLNLTPTGDGNYTATGADAKGVTYDITVEQQPKEIRFTWESSKGKKGDGTFAY